MQPSRLLSLIRGRCCDTAATDLPSFLLLVRGYKTRKPWKPKNDDEYDRYYQDFLQKQRRVAMKQYGRSQHDEFVVEMDDLPASKPKGPKKKNAQTASRSRHKGDPEPLRPPGHYVRERKIPGHSNPSREWLKVSKGPKGRYVHLGLEFGEDDSSEFYGHPSSRNRAVPNISSGSGRKQHTSFASHFADYEETNNRQRGSGAYDSESAAEDCGQQSESASGSGGDSGRRTSSTTAGTKEYGRNGSGEGAAASASSSQDTANSKKQQSSKEHWQGLSEDEFHNVVFEDLPKGKKAKASASSQSSRRQRYEGDSDDEFDGEDEDEEDDWWTGAQSQRMYDKLNKKARPQSRQQYFRPGLGQRRSSLWDEDVEGFYYASQDDVKDAEAAIRSGMYGRAFTGWERAYYSNPNNSGTSSSSTYDSASGQKTWWDQFSGTKMGGSGSAGASSSSSSNAYDGKFRSHASTGQQEFGKFTEWYENLGSSNTPRKPLPPHLLAQCQVLGLSSTVAPDIEAIRSAFHKCAHTWHPDKHQNATKKAEAEVQFKKVQEAYQALKDHVTSKPGC